MQRSNGAWGTKSVFSCGCQRNDGICFRLLVHPSREPAFHSTHVCNVASCQNGHRGYTAEDGSVIRQLGPTGMIQGEQNVEAVGNALDEHDAFNDVAAYCLWRANTPIVEVFASDTQYPANLVGSRTPIIEYSKYVPKRGLHILIL